MGEFNIKSDTLKHNGVYLIHNKFNNKNYVGSTSNLDTRIKTHKHHLAKGCHINRKLQNDYDQYGPDAFEFKILEMDIAKDMLTAYEKYYIYAYDAIVKYKGYNEVMPTLNNKKFQIVCKEKKKTNMEEKLSMGKKDLEISEVKGAKANISDLKVYGDVDTFLLLCKASSQEQGWMKSTKVCNCAKGCIVQVTTQQENPDGSYAVAEALTYVPDMNISKNSEPRKLIYIGGR